MTYGVAVRIPRLVGVVIPRLIERGIGFEIRHDPDGVVVFVDYAAKEELDRIVAYGA